MEMILVAINRTRNIQRGVVGIKKGVTYFSRNQDTTGERRRRKRGIPKKTIKSTSTRIGHRGRTLRKNARGEKAGRNVSDRD